MVYYTAKRREGSLFKRKAARPALRGVHKDMEYGVQIFGCLRDFRKDPEGFFARLSQMGYKQVEPCVLFGDASSYPAALAELVWKPQEVPGFQEMMEGHGLALRSCHVFSRDMLAAAGEMAELAQKTSIGTYVVNCPPDIAKVHEGFAKDCRALSEKLAQSGTALWLHNNAPEIEARVRGDEGEITVMEAILREAGEGLGAQVDTGWVLYGGIDPAAFLKRLGKRLRSVHFKDMAENCRALSGTDRFAVLGSGVTDIPAVMAEIPEGMPVLVDQDAAQGDFLEDLSASIKALRAVRP